jgi:hypothetical protein
LDPLGSERGVCRLRVVLDVRLSTVSPVSPSPLQTPNRSQPTAASLKMGAGGHGTNLIGAGGHGTDLGADLLGGFGGGG